MSDIQRRKLTIRHRNRDYELSYFVRQAGGSTILYLHGLGNTKQDFEGALVSEALNDYSLVGFDFPGCGESRSYYPEIPLGMDDLAAITHKLVLVLALEDITIIGQSLGGVVGLLFARSYPKQLARFVNVEGNLTPEDCDIQSRDVFRHLFLGHEEAFFATVQKRLTDDNKPGFKNFVTDLRKHIVDRAYFDYCRSIVDYSDGFPLLQQFIGLPMPTLYIHGSANSQLTQLKQLTEVGTSVVSVPDSDHFPTLTNPNYFYAAVSKFINDSSLNPMAKTGMNGDK